MYTEAGFDAEYPVTFGGGIGVVPGVGLCRGSPGLLTGRVDKHPIPRRTIRISELIMIRMPHFCIFLPCLFEKNTVLIFRPVPSLTGTVVPFCTDLIVIYRSMENSSFSTVTV